MKAKTSIALLGATLLVLGCNLAVPGSATFTGFEAGSRLTGKFTFGGKVPSQALTAAYRAAGASTTSGTVAVDPAKLGYFAFTSSDIKDGDYQIVYSDGGELVTSMDVNTISFYASDTIKSPPSDLSQPQVTMDLKWEVKEFKPAMDTKLDGKFSFTKAGELPGAADYYVTVGSLDKAKDPKDGKANPKTVCWTSSPTTDSSVSWSGKCSTVVGDTSGTTPDATASLFYRVAFVKAGTAQDFSAKKDFHGQTAWIPFTL